ncbi:PhoPQ-activated pathogenicity-related family protein [Fontisphaera persica]|uniref:PhoPQ-activated pathogenicity-related family protein n=1 Tax=Fontisphaera persica TaxID=2974023 RepID=UPI0024BFFA0A|nr:PhoPQ-activated pathogenicity-related family protein [Fontisphaera persica]WCJ60285.1 PhoPQ-activated pathogenicity-related family protein [Fontisphaera persica]
MNILPLMKRRAGFLITASNTLMLWTAAGICAMAATAAEERVRATPPTALDRYVASPDTNYQWQVVNTFTADQAKVVVIELTSQSWLTPQEVNRTLWRHWLTLTIPSNATHQTALLLIGGGSNDRPAPTKPDANALLLASTTRSVVANLSNVPNQPLVFADRTNRMSEDALIAYTWDKFLRTGDERWPARLPMTKAAVRAMDTITAFCATAQGGQRTIRHFVVAGASKRGWTTWAAGAVDPRVTGIMPVVIDVLNVVPSLKAHYAAYGFFAPAVGNYTYERIPDWMDTPQCRQLMRIEDPYEYRARYTLPKFIVTAAGDQFFPVDSARYYFDALPGPKYLRTIPNADHSLRGTDGWMSLLAFYEALLNQRPLPEFEWKHGEPGQLELTCKSQPTEVKLWTATNPKARDFRLESLGPAWTSTTLSPTRPGSYSVRVPKPAEGWTAYFVELKFPSGVALPFVFTTDARVVPDTYPFKWTAPASPPPPRTQ